MTIFALSLKYMYGVGVLYVCIDVRFNYNLHTCYTVFDMNVVASCLEFTLILILSTRRDTDQKFA